MRHIASQGVNAPRQLCDSLREGATFTTPMKLFREIQEGEDIPASALAATIKGMEPTIAAGVKWSQDRYVPHFVPVPLNPDPDAAAKAMFETRYINDFSTRIDWDQNMPGTKAVLRKSASAAVLAAVPQLVAENEALKAKLAVAEKAGMLIGLLKTSAGDSMTYDLIEGSELKRIEHEADKVPDLVAQNERLTREVKRLNEGWNESNQSALESGLVKNKRIAELEALVKEKTIALQNELGDCHPFAGAMQMKQAKDERIAELDTALIPGSLMDAACKPVGSVSCIHQYDANACCEALKTKSDRISELETALNEAMSLIVRHHDSSYQCGSGLFCPVCSPDGKDEPFDKAFNALNRKAGETMPKVTDKPIGLTSPREAFQPPTGQPLVTADGKTPGELLFLARHDAFARNQTAKQANETACAAVLAAFGKQAELSEAQQKLKDTQWLLKESVETMMKYKAQCDALQPKPELVPFSIERWNTGERDVVYRNGEKPDAVAVLDNWPTAFFIRSVLNQHDIAHMENGRYSCSVTPANYDLLMPAERPQVKELWLEVNPKRMLAGYYDTSRAFEDQKITSPGWISVRIEIPSE